MDYVNSGKKLARETLLRCYVKLYTRNVLSTDVQCPSRNITITIVINQTQFFCLRCVQDWSKSIFVCVSQKLLDIFPFSPHILNRPTYNIRFFAFASANIHELIFFCRKNAILALTSFFFEKRE